MSEAKKEDAHLEEYERYAYGADGLEPRQRSGIWTERSPKVEREFSGPFWNHSEDSFRLFDS